MLIIENEIYIYSENQNLSDDARRFYLDNSKNSPQKALSDSLKNSVANEIVALVLFNGTIYLAAKGGALVKIVRNNISAVIIKSMDENVVTASGFSKVGDIYHLQLTNLENHELEVGVPAPIINQPLSFQSKIKSFISGINFKLPLRNIYIKPEFTDEVSPQSKKLTFSIAIILLVLLAVSIGFGMRQKKINDVRSKYLGILKQAQDEVDQAISLAGVSSDKSRQLFTDAEAKIALIDVMKVKDNGLITLKDKINESRAAILGEYLVTPEMFLDLTLLSSGFKGDSVGFSGGQIYVMDSAGKRIVSVNSATKKSKVVAGPSVINSALGMACYEDRVFVLESDGIYEISGNNASKVVNKTWSGEALIAAFAGNMYVIDKSGNQIYRYAGANNSFGEKQNWLSPGTNVSFNSVSQMTIDGIIYALYPNSKVLKFSQGSPLNFNISGVTPEIGNINAIYANPDNQNVYVLDKAGKRVVVLDKKGAYKGQYVNELIANASSLVVSEKDAKIILLTGDKLYSLDIK